MHFPKLPYLSLAGLALATTLATAQSPVVINEVYYDAPGGDDGQVFVELYGPGGFDISGWTVQGIEGTTSSPATCNPDTFTFPNGTLIPNDGFVVVADEQNGTGTTMVANADFIVGDMDLENGPDAVALIDNNGRVVDSVAYGAVDTTVTVSPCTGGPWFEGNPARDVFAPLSIERCPAGTDTNNNDVDFTANNPTPGVGSSCCKALEYVSTGSGSTISASAGNSVGLDSFFTPCGANQLYATIIALTDPAVVPPPAPFPVYDSTTADWLGASIGNPPPFTAFIGFLDANGRNVGNTFFDFSGVAVVVPSGFDIWVATVAIGPSLSIESTNAVRLTIAP